MSRTEVGNKETEDEGHGTIDRAVEEALDLDFASFEDVKSAFRS